MAQPDHGRGWSAVGFEGRYLPAIGSWSKRVRRTSFRTSLAAISGFGLVVRVTYVELFSSHINIGLDSIWYQLESATIASGAGFVDPSRFFGERVSVATAYRPPLYPAFLAGTSRLFDG